MSERILVVEDEPDILEVVSYNLKNAGFEIVALDNGEAAVFQVEDLRPDLIVLDLMLPGMDGLEVCRTVKQREATKHIPVVMLTAKTEEVDRIVGLELGADDYVVKPFSTPELLARVRAMLRRARPETISTVLKVGDVELDRETHRVRRRGRDIKLGPTEFRLLEFLMSAPSRVYSRSQLLDGVWGHDVYVDERTVDVHVGRLRKALNLANMRDIVRTVRGAGYSIEG